MVQDLDAKMNAELERFKQRNQTDKDSAAYFEIDFTGQGGL